MRAGVLLGLLVLAVVGRAHEAAAVKAIEKLGGGVGRDAKRPGNPVVSVRLMGSEVTDARVQELQAALRGLQIYR